MIISRLMRRTRPSFRKSSTELVSSHFGKEERRVRCVAVFLRGDVVGIDAIFRRGEVTKPLWNVVLRSSWTMSGLGERGVLASFLCSSELRRSCRPQQFRCERLNELTIEAAGRHISSFDVVLLVVDHAFDDVLGHPRGTNLRSEKRRTRTRQLSSDIYTRSWSCVRSHSQHRHLSVSRRWIWVSSGN